MSFSVGFRQVTSHLSKTLRHHAGLQLATILVLVSCFSIVSGVITVSENLERILTLWGESFEVSVYLSDTATAQETQQLEVALKGNEKIDKLKFVSKESALAAFREQMVSYAPDLMNDPELIKIIPTSFQFAVNAKVPVADHLIVSQTLAGTIKNMAGVDDVSFGQDWVKNYAGVVKAISAVGGLFSIVILFAVVFVVSNTVRTSIGQRRYEIEVLELIGATPKYIRQPYIWEGGIIGGVSCGLAILLSYGFFSALKNHLKSHLALMQLSSHIEFMSPIFVSMLLLFSVVLGVCASYACVRVINDGWSASQRSQKR